MASRCRRPGGVDRQSVQYGSCNPMAAREPTVSAAAWYGRARPHLYEMAARRTIRRAFAIAQFPTDSGRFRRPAAAAVLTAVTAARDFGGTGTAPGPHRRARRWTC